MKDKFVPTIVGFLCNWCHYQKGNYYAGPKFAMSEKTFEKQSTSIICE